MVSFVVLCLGLKLTDPIFIASRSLFGLIEKAAR
jgi:hypothetical protein